MKMPPMNPRRLRLLLVSLVVLALLAVALWPSARLVDSAEAGPGLVQATVEAEGRTRVRDRYLLAAPVNAIARRLALEPGDPVVRGDVLVVLDATASPTLDRRSREEAVARAEAARARLAAAREETRAAVGLAVQARADDDRLQALLQRQLVAADAAEHARTARLRAEREAASARFREATSAHELEAALAALGQGGPGNGEAAMVLSAPVDGVVLRRYFESARPVQVGEPLLEIGDPAGLEVEVDVLSADAVNLRPDMRVELVRWGGPGAIPARVRRVEPGGFTKVSALGVEEQRVWAILALDEADRPPALGDAYRVHARFILDELDAAVRVPASALFRHGDGLALFRVEGGRARLLPVQVGLQGGGWAAVLHGLEAGDRVVVHPDRELGDGARVKVRR